MMTSPISSRFNESDIGKTQSLFIFREFEKYMKKKTPKVPFHKFVPQIRKGRKQYPREPIDHDRSM